ncbi:DUF2750 domain-containing protein [Archangium sp.]|uniref:DUF2750 domain-containing protein n=1 Tax=Archangium sp. TaxID=1872627 RepID=UPI00389AF1F1
MEREQESQERLQSVLKLPAARRYSYFLQRVVESGEVWGLDGEGWALALDDSGRDVLPLWPAPEFAALCANRLWSGFQPRAMRLEDLLENVLPQLEEEGMPVGVFFTPDGHGHPVTARELIEDLRTARGPLA